MVDKQIRAILLGRLRITPQALSQRAKKIKTGYGPMSTDEAVYVIAHQHGVDLSRHLTIETIDRVRSLVPRDLPRIESSKVKKTQEKTKQRDVESRYPLVSKMFLMQSVVIGHKSFPEVFVLENSIRELIIRILSKIHGPKWWETAISKNIRDAVQHTIEKERKYPHREKRGVHPIFYSNFVNLKDIILQNRKLFSGIIVDFQWFEVQMDQVYMARNALAHSTLISEDDTARIHLFYRDWGRLLEAAGY